MRLDTATLLKAAVTEAAIEEAVKAAMKSSRRGSGSARPGSLAQLRVPERQPSLLFRLPLPQCLCMLDLDLAWIVHVRGQR